jgi:hypothetical protein
MAVLEQSEEDGIGGALELYLFKESDVSADTGENFLFSNYTKIIYIPESIRFTEKQKKTASGTIFLPKIIYTLALDRADLQKFCKDNIGNFFIALLKTSNGDTLKIGTKENPLELNFDRDSGRKYTDRSERNFELSGEVDSESIFYTNSLDLTTYLSISEFYLVPYSIAIDYYVILNWDLGPGADTDMVSVKVINEQKSLEYTLSQITGRNNKTYSLTDIIYKIPGTSPGDLLKVGISVRNGVGTDSPYIYSEQYIRNIPTINLGVEIFTNFLCLKWADNTDYTTAWPNDKLIINIINLTTMQAFIFQPAKRNATYINIPGAFGEVGANILIEYRMQNAEDKVSSIITTYTLPCQPAVVFSLSPNEFSFSPSVNSRMVAITSNRPWQVVDGAANVSPNVGTGNANVVITQNALSGQGERNYLFKNNLNMFLNVKVTVGAYLSPTSEILLDVDTNGSFTIEGNVGNWTAFLSMQDIFQSFSPSSGGNGNTAINYFVSLYDLEEFWVDGQSTITLRYRNGDSNVDLVYPIGFYLANVVISLGDTVESQTNLMIFNWADNSLNILSRNNDKLLVEIKNLMTNATFNIAESAGVRRDAATTQFQNAGLGSAGDVLEVKYYTKRANGWKSRTTTLNVTIQESISLAGIFLVADSFTFDYYAILNWDLVAGPDSDLVSVKLLNELKALEHTLPEVAGRNDNSYDVLDLLQKLPNTTPGDIIKIGISVRNGIGTDSPYIYTEQAIAVIPNISMNAEVFANLLHIDWVDNSNGSTAFADDILFLRLKNLATLEVFEFPPANRNSVNANFDGRTFGASGNNMLIEYRMQNASNNASSIVGSLNLVCQAAVVFSITPNNFTFSPSLNSTVVAITSNRPWEVLSNAGDVSPNTGTGNENATITKNLALGAGTANYLFKNNLGMFINAMAEIEAFLMPTAELMLDAETNGSITITGNRGNWTALVSPQNIFQSFSPSSGGNGNTEISYFASLSDLETFYIDGSSNLTLSYTNTANVLVDLVFPIKFSITNIALVVADSVASPGRLVLNWTDNSANLLSRNNDKIVAEIKNLTTNAVFSITEADGVTRESLTKIMTGSFGSVGQILEVKYNTIRANGWKSTTTTLNITIQAVTYLIASTGNNLVDGAGNRLTTF